MCVNCDIVWADRSQWGVSTCGELAAAFGMQIHELPLNCSDPRSPVADDECLCWIDMPALAARHGMTCDAPDYSPNSLHWDAYVLRECAGELGGEGR